MMSNDGNVILVTGASRGLGQGMARECGKTGATVYLTSRAASQDALLSVASEVEAAGGRAIPIAVDQSSYAEVEALFGRIAREQGRLDILVNNAAVNHPALPGPGAFWEKPVELSEMIETPLRANFITAFYAAPLMVDAGRGLIANISFYGAASYHYSPAYGAAKAGTDKLTFDMARDLRPHGVACVSIWPGLIYSDAVARHVESIPADKAPPGLAERFAAFERPEFTAKVIAALADDPELMAHSGQALIGAELGRRYGIVDLDGKQPVSYRETMGSPLQFFEGG